MQVLRVTREAAALLLPQIIGNAMLTTRSACSPNLSKSRSIRGLRGDLDFVQSQRQMSGDHAFFHDEGRAEICPMDTAKVGASFFVKPRKVSPVRIQFNAPLQLLSQAGRNLHGWRPRLRARAALAAGGRGVVAAFRSLCRRTWFEPVGCPPSARPDLDGPRAAIPPKAGPFFLPCCLTPRARSSTRFRQ
jgi:hypothetical protein